jgi:hypothetical protein
MAVQWLPNRGPCQSSSFNTYHWTELKIYQNLPDVVLYVAGVLACFGQRDLSTSCTNKYYFRIESQPFRATDNKRI